MTDLGFKIQVYWLQSLCAYLQCYTLITAEEFEPIHFRALRTLY